MTNLKGSYMPTLKILFLLISVIVAAVAFVGPNTGRFNLVAAAIAFGFASFLVP